MLTSPAAITHDTAAACVAHWMSQLPMGDGQVVQLSGAGLQRFDSSALSALLCLRRRLTERNQRLVCTDLPRHLRDLAALYGVDVLLAA